jgi:hypothetical protein
MPVEFYRYQTKNKWKDREWFGRPRLFQSKKGLRCSLSQVRNLAIGIAIQQLGWNGHKLQWFHVDPSELEKLLGPKTFAKIGNLGYLPQIHD